ncbi:hypothetical protein CLD22_27820, partial [Rubrivivax gelatinosus]|nr:hypothetical protein [Rubrivivax gelatinosus]
MTVRAHAGLLSGWRRRAVLYLPCDGDAGTTAFVDGARGRAVSARGAAQVTTAPAQVGTGACVLNGSTSYLFVASSGDFAFAGDYTIAGWVRQDSTAVTGDRGIFCAGVGGGLSMGLSAGKLYCGPNNVAYGAIASSAIATDVFVHVAAVRRSGRTRCFVAGGVVADVADTRSYNAGAVGVGANSVNNFSAAGQVLKGHIDD